MGKDEEDGLSSVTPRQRLDSDKPPRSSHINTKLLVLRFPFVAVSIAFAVNKEVCGTGGGGGGCTGSQSS